MTTFPKTRAHPWEKRLTYGVEAVAGTAAVTTYAEECHQFAIAKMQATETEMGYLGIAADRFDTTLVQQHGEPAANLAARADGFAAVALACLIGDTGYAVSGAGPYVHPIKPSPTGTTVCTMSLWDTLGAAGGTNDTELATYATPTSVRLSANPSAALTVDAAFTSKYPTDTTKPTPTHFIGETGSAVYKKQRLFGNKATYTLYSSAGVAYTFDAISADISIARPIEIVPNPNGLDLVDIVSGVIETAGTISFVYDGMDAGKIYKDFKAFNELGDATHIHAFRWTDANANYIELKWWPMRVSVTLDPSGQALKGTASFISYQDIATASGGSPTLTQLVQATIQNDWTTRITIGS